MKCSGAIVGSVGLIVILASTCEWSKCAEPLPSSGSTVGYPLMVKWGSEYESATGRQVGRYQSVGSAKGIRQMVAKECAFACVDAAMTEEQLKSATRDGGNVLHIPLALRAVAPVYNLGDIEEPLCFTDQVLADIFLGKITKWDDAAIKNLNPAIRLPAQNINVVYHGNPSGTTAIFTEYLSKGSKEWKEHIGSGLTVKWPVGVGAKGGEGPAGFIAKTPGAIGYLELAYVLENKTPHGKVKNRAGEFVLGSTHAVRAAAQGADIPADLRFSLLDGSDKAAYPISTAIWAVFYSEQRTARAAELNDFFKWVMGDGQKHVEKFHFGRLPDALLEKAQAMVSRINKKD
jgi:phosphate transport system substrate-binding protein